MIMIDGVDYLKYLASVQIMANRITIDYTHYFKLSQTIKYSIKLE